MIFRLVSLFLVFCGYCVFAFENLQVEAEVISIAKKNWDKCQIGIEAGYWPNGLKWECCLQKMKRDIPLLTTTEEAVLYAQSKGRLDFDHRGIITPEIAMAYENSLCDEFPHFANSLPLISESIYSDEESLLFYNGRWVSDIFYYHYRYVLQCLTYEPISLIFSNS